MLEALYSYATEFRNWLFDQEIIKSKKMDVPVISVGNLTVGGTGKTPVIQYLGRILNKKGIRAGIVSRGYGGCYEGVVKVNIESDTASKTYGDEPCLLAQTTHLPVYLAKKRVQAAELLIKTEGVKLVLADDAFQHRWLGRELDIVILDAQEELINYQLLPFGRLRESLDAVKRADVIIINKINLVSADQANEVRRFVKNLLQRFEVSPLLIEGTNHIKSWFDLKGHAVLMDKKRVVLLSAIAQPRAFEKLVTDSFYVDVLEHFQFSDHYDYKESSLRPLVQLLSENSEVVVLTTAKDAVKLKDLSIEHKERFFVSDLTLELDKKELLIEKINSLNS